MNHDLIHVISWLSASSVLGFVSVQLMKSNANKYIRTITLCNSQNSTYKHKNTVREVPILFRRYACIVQLCNISPACVLQSSAVSTCTIEVNSALLAARPCQCMHICCWYPSVLHVSLTTAHSSQSGRQHYRALSTVPHCQLTHVP